MIISTNRTRASEYFSTTSCRHREGEDGAAEEREWEEVR